ncbi:hypothetical protein EX30DRAFT_342359 [Ascodesmis nigricans]|uniref:Uncharacterized protein n=1 Tax=Ascodesmis nigricans TaxID=341454 RepID=A0A4V3SIB3_9PEZI|nr:hypothetical protein EX30DRAFT_342359 [Ascodesmis nigricans]
MAGTPIGSLESLPSARCCWRSAHVGGGDGDDEPSLVCAILRCHSIAIEHCMSLKT